MTKFKKIALGLGASVAAVTPIAATVSCSLFGKNTSKSSYEFWNYEDYMEEGMQDQVNKVFNYSEFKDLPQFKQALNDSVAAGGIGSDYFNATLAAQGSIQKIDFARLYGISTDRATWKETLHKYYSPETWKLLTSFKLAKQEYKDHKWVIVKDDQGQTTADIDGDGVDDELWEYMAPYFIQNKVIGVNLERLKSHDFGAKDKDGHYTISQVDFETAVKTALGTKPATYKNILDVIKLWGGKRIAVNDYMRDNLMIGSENPTDGTGFTGDASNYQAQLSGLKNVLSGWSKTYPSSGVENLESLINNDVDSADTAFMYNGDALYAWYGGGKDADASKIRMITPLNPTYLLDGFVISSQIKNDPLEMDRIYNLGRNVLYNGVNTSYKEYEKQGDDYVVKAGSTPFAGYASQNNIYTNFDSVNYSPAFRALYDYCDDGYFVNDDGSTDDVAKAMFESTHETAKSHVADFQNHITQPLEDNLTITIQDAYRTAKRSM